MSEVTVSKVFDFTLLFKGIPYKMYGHDALFCCPCKNGHGGGTTFNASFNIVTGELIVFGACKTRFGRGQNKNLFRWLRQDCDFDLSVSDYTKIDANQVTIVQKDEYDWRALLSLPIARDNEYLLKERTGITNELIEKYELRGDRQRIVMPNRDITGKIVGVNIRYQYRDVRYIYYGERTPMFNMNMINEFDASKPLVLVEGAFGAINLVGKGVQSLAMLGTGGIKDDSTLDRFDKVLVGLDDDAAGLDMAKKLVKRSDIMFRFLKPTAYDELTENDLYDIINGRQDFLINLYEREYYGKNN